MQLTGFQVVKDVCSFYAYDGMQQLCVCKESPMDFTLTPTAKVRIVYYSGTGSTAKVAETMKELLEKNGNRVTITSLRENDRPYSPVDEDLLIVIFAVYAFGSPFIVRDWIHSLPPVNGLPTVVLSVSGGGEVFPNSACRLVAIKALEKKGFSVFYERMLVMPSNWIINVPDKISVRLLTVLPDRLAAIIDDLLHGTVLRKRTGLFKRFASGINKYESSAGKSFASKFILSDKCNGCGLCEKGCPNANIHMQNGLPVFGKNCLLCLNCIYSCPQKAISPKSMKFVVIKEGYSFQRIASNLDNIPPATDEELPRNYLWIGVTKYLEGKW
jgi:ferredoxin/flavodoxin